MLFYPLMSIKPVLMIGNPLLREKSSEIIEVSAESGSELNVILQDLKDTLTYLQSSKNIGRALAAPQIGHMKRIIYLQTPARTFVMVNPKITVKSKELIEVWDSCYSFDVAFFVKIKRHKKIKVEYQDEHGKIIHEEVDGSLSELFQHEIDHLDGILATDYLEDNKNIISREEWEKRYR